MSVVSKAAFAQMGLVILIIGSQPCRRFPPCARMSRAEERVCTRRRHACCPLLLLRYLCIKADYVQSTVPQRPRKLQVSDRFCRRTTLLSPPNNNSALMQYALCDHRSLYLTIRKVSHSPKDTTGTRLLRDRLLHTPS